MLKGLKCLGSPDGTSFATFVCMKKQIMCTISWKKSLKYVRKLNRQNLRQRSSAYVIVWLPRQNEFRNFCMHEETDNVYHKLEEVIGVC